MFCTTDFAPATVVIGKKAHPQKGWLKIIT